VIDEAALTTPVGENPLDTFARLGKITGPIERVGEERVRGVPTVHFRTTVDASRGMADAESLRNLLVDVWLDDDDRPLRHRQTMTLDDPGGTTVVSTMESFDHGKAVAIELPPADQVGDFDTHAIVEANLDALTKPSDEVLVPKAAPLSVDEHRPAELVPQPLIVEDEGSDRLRELRPLPRALEPAGLLRLLARGGGTRRLDRVCRRAELVRRDVGHRRRLAGGVGGVPRCALQRPRRAHRVATRRPRRGHRDLAARPRPHLFDRLARPSVRRLHRLEQVQHVLRARRRPQRQQAMVLIRERAPAPQGDEAGIAVLGEDHGRTVVISVPP
jgi:hypothetical protein